MKLSKDELIKKYSEKLKDKVEDDVTIELMEDVSDSMGEVDTTEIEALKAENEKLIAERDEIKTRYKERFLESDIKEPEEDKKIVEEKEVIDVKEI